MTKKELEEEARFRTKGWKEQENCVQAYLAAAEPREEQIAELEDEHVELIGKVAFLENDLNNAKARFEKENNRLILNNKLLSEKVISITRERLDLQKENAKLKRDKEILVKAIKGLNETVAETMLYANEGCPDVLCEDCHKDCELKKIVEQANDGLDFDKIAEEIEQDIKEQKKYD